MRFLFDEKDFVAIIMYSKRRFGYASVYRWPVNALRPTKPSLGMVLQLVFCVEGPSYAATNLTRSVSVHFNSYSKIV